MYIQLLFVNCGLHNLYIRKMCNEFINTYLSIHLSITPSIRPSLRSSSHPSILTSRFVPELSQHTSVAHPAPVEITHSCSASCKLVSVDLGAQPYVGYRCCLSPLCNVPLIPLSPRLINPFLFFKLNLMR